MKKNVTVTRGTLQKTLHYLKPYGALFSLSLLFALITVAATLYFPLLVGQIIDGIIAGSNIRTQLYTGLILVVVTALSQWLMNVSHNRIAYGAVRRLRGDVFRKIRDLPVSYFHDHPTGETVSRMVSDIDQFTDGILMGFSQFFTGILTIVGTLAFMFSIDWRVTVPVILITPLSLFVASFISRRTYRLFGEQSELRATGTALTDEMIAGHKTVLAFGQEDAVSESYREINEKYRKTASKALFFSSLTNPSTRFVNNLVYTAVALFGALLCMRGGQDALTVGALSCFLTYANQYTKPFNEISGVIAELQNALACADRVFALLDVPSEPLDGDAERLSFVSGEVDLCHVAFSYVKDKPLLRDFNLHLAPGQRAAIVGPTGCGKTTVIHLLMRFYDPDRGEIRIDGKDTRQLSRASVRSAFGMVLQETWLCAGTVADNIRFGNPNASDDEVKAAAVAARADGFISRLPHGYDTVIGEDGGALSEGQKQLLCIARVMLTRPQMLILDEATSSIDTRTELKIQEAFASLMQGKTSFIVAHRLSTVETADVILVMKDGDVIEQGSHTELLRKGGFYAKLYQSQFRH